MLSMLSHPPAALSVRRPTSRNISRSSRRMLFAVLSAGSRREMTRRHWRNPHSSAERHYGLGVMIGNTEGWDWFGHGGGLQGYASFTCVVPERELTVCVLVNASGGWAGYWVEGALHILRRFATRGAPSENVRDWAGRWWTLWGAGDLVPVGDV